MQFSVQNYVGACLEPQAPLQQYIHKCCKDVFQMLFKCILFVCVCQHFPERQTQERGPGTTGTTAGHKWPREQNFKDEPRTKLYTNSAALGKVFLITFL